MSRQAPKQASQAAECLLQRLRTMDNLLIAHSGGLDSSLLVHAAGLAGIRALAVTGSSATTPPADLEDAVRVAAASGVPHRIIESEEMSDERFIANPPERCYYCKDALFSQLAALARAEGYAYIAYGATKSDLGDHRPGMRAAREHGILSPLIDCGLDKASVRALARELGLSVWDKPASPCLSSRFPYGVRISAEGLGRVARAEALLRDMLQTRELRVRDHDGVARLELASEPDMRHAFERREEIVQALMALGYTSVLMDLEGLQSGKLNRALQGKDRYEK